jgi:tetrahydromethanopterin S-methyltransferase subunit G
MEGKEMAQTDGRKASDNSKIGYYIGIGLLAAGIMTALGMILCGRSRSENLSSVESAADAANKSLQKIRKDSEANKAPKVIITPAEYQKEERISEHGPHSGLARP